MDYMDYTPSKGVRATFEPDGNLSFRCKNCGHGNIASTEQAQMGHYVNCPTRRLERLQQRKKLRSLSGMT